MDSTHLVLLEYTSTTTEQYVDVHMGMNRNTNMNESCDTACTQERTNRTGFIAELNVEEISFSFKCE